MNNVSALTLVRATHAAHLWKLDYAEDNYSWRLKYISDQCLFLAMPALS